MSVQAELTTQCEQGKITLTYSSDISAKRYQEYITFALPETAEVLITIKPLRVHPWAGDTSGIHAIVTEYPEAKIESRFSYRGIDVARAVIQPIYKNENGSFLIADSCIITITSKGFVSNPKYRIPKIEKGLLSHIINSEHIPAAIAAEKKSESPQADHWYKSGQSYVRLITKKDGIARFPLNKALALQPEWKGKPISHLDLLFKGSSYAMGIIDSDGMLDEKDILVFAARRAEGDTTWRNYVTDEASFFLTLNNQPSTSPRYTAFPPIMPILADTSVQVRMHHEKDSEFYAGDVISPIDYRYLASDFSTGKNFFWNKISTIQKFRTFRDTIHVPSAQSPLSVDIAFHGANDRPSIDFEHRFDIFWNDNLIKRDSFAGFADHVTSMQVAPSMIQHGPNILRIESIPNSDTIITECFINHVTTSSISFPRMLNGELAFEDSLSNAASISLKDLRTASFIVLDTARNFILNGIASASGQQFVGELSLIPGLFKGFVADSLSWVEPIIQSVSKSTLRESPRQADVLLISHPAFMNASERLAEHRRKQGYSVSVISSDDIYKEFGHGSKDAHAIKDFIRHTHRSWQFPVPAYVILMGDASWDPLKLTFKAHQEDFIPSFGFPVSDIWYTTPSNDSIDPELIIGRLSVSSSLQAEQVVDKLIQYDTLPAGPWMKNFLFLSGGDADDPFFHNQFDGIAPFVLDPPISGDTVRIRRINKVGGVDESIATKIRSAVNDGTLWVNFAGHGSPEYFELDGWRAQDLNNPRKYFMLTTFSCNSGAFAEPTTVCRNESYVLEQGKGAIASVGNTYTGITTPDYYNFVTMYTALSKYGLRNIGDLVFATKIGQGNTTDPFFRNSMMQFCLIGDPLSKLAITPQPDYYVRSEDMQVNLVTATDENFTVQGVIRNRGTMDTIPVQVRCIRSVADRKDTLTITYPAFAREQNVSFTFPTLNQSGIHGIDIMIDPAKSVKDEIISANNTLAFPVNVYAATLTVIDPLPGWNVQAEKPRFRFLLPLRNREFTSYDLRIEALDGAVIAGFSGTQSPNLTFGELHVDWTPNIVLAPGRSTQDYILFTRTFDARTIQYSPWEVTPFHALSTPINDTAFLHVDKLSALPESRTIGLNEQSSSKALMLGSRNIPLLIESCNGGEDYRYGYLRFGNRTFIERVDGSKWNLLHLKQFDSIGIYKDFDAFYGGQEERYRAGNSGDLIRYLRDSVAVGDHVAISVSDGSFRGALVTPNGMDGDAESFMSTLKSFGAIKIDSVFKANLYPNGTPISNDDRYRISYAMYGMKGALPGSAKELYGAYTDTLSLDIEHSVAFQNGRYSSGPIGPAIEWNRISMQDSLSDQGTLKYYLHGWNGAKQNRSLLDSSLTGTFPVEKINASSYPYLEIETVLSRKAGTQGPILQTLDGAYRPAAELAPLPSSFNVKGTEQRPGGPIRGDSMICELDIYNLSLRQYSDPLMRLCITQQPLGGGGTSETSTSSMPIIPKDTPISYQMKASTFELSKVSEWTARINCEQNRPELFSFNNSAKQTLTIGEDTEPPTIEILADGKVVREYDVVALNPRITVRILDNSFVPIDTTKTFIRTNPFAVRSDKNIKEYAFIRGSYGTAMRAEFSYIPEGRLEIGENIIYVITEDASANKDTLRRTVLVVLNSSINELSNYPNPVLSGTPISFDLTYASQMREALYALTIADMRGSIIHTLKGKLSIGRNTIEWNGRNSEGIPMPPGVYVYRLDISGDTFIEPSYGKMIIVE
ncbi:MAG: C25 family cysteine peptidase [bacterium]